MQSQYSIISLSHSDILRDAGLNPFQYLHQFSVDLLLRLDAQLICHVRIGFRGLALRNVGTVSVG